MFHVHRALRFAPLSGFIVLLLAGSLASAQSLSDGSFEQPVLAAGSYVVASGGTIVGSPWTFAGGFGSKGISTNGSAFTFQTGPTPYGNQVGVIQGDGTLSQTINFPSAGNYKVSLSAALRKENSNLQGSRLGIEVDGVSGFSATPAGSTYATYTTTAFALAAGSHTITVRGTNNFPGQDNTVFIDAVSIATVANPPPTVSIAVAPSAGLSAPASVTISASASDSNGINRVEFYGDAALLGTKTTAPYTWIWTNMAAGTRTAMAKAFDNLGASASATQTVTVGTPPAGNVVDGGFEQPMLAAGSYVVASGGTIVGSPWTFAGGFGSKGISTNGSAFTFQTGPTPYGNQVGVIQGDGTLSQTVNFPAAGTYKVSLSAALRKENSNLQGSRLGIEVDGVSGFSATPAGSTYATYTTTAFSLAAGSHTITVRGTNNFPGQDNTVFIDAVNVFATTNPPPTVSLTITPSTGLIAPANVTLSASASDSDGINRVEFYVDGVLLGSDATAPYSIAWNNIAAGSHTALAKAFDNLGASSTASQTITVDAPPTVSLSLAPSTGLTAPASVLMSAAASDPDGTVSRVEFYGDGALLGTKTTAPYTWIWTNMLAGTRVAMAKAFDNLGASATATQTVTVGAPPAGNVVDGGFEQPMLAAGSYQAAAGTTIVGSPWTFGGANGSRGISTNGSLFTTQTGPTPYGNQVAFIQGDGTISQTVNLPASGNYKVSLSAALRKENTNLQGSNLGIEVDGISRFSAPPAGSTYAAYSTTALSLAAGSHTITVRGTNRFPGQDNTVFIDAVSVAPAVNPPPTVTIAVAPSTGLIAPANVTLSATATDPDGINRVEFWVDGGKLATVTSAPYSAAWNSIGAGTHTVIATAYDSLGASASASTTITVGAPPTASGPFFGYFGDCPTCMSETYQHINLIFAVCWGYINTDQALQDVNNCLASRLVEAKQAGITNAILTVGHLVYIGQNPADPQPPMGTIVYRGANTAKPYLRSLFNLLRLNGVLGMVTALYPVDEPDMTLYHPTDASIAAVNADILAVASEYPELAGVKLAVIYSENFQFPGISSYDWVAFDSYKLDSGMFGTDVCDPENGCVHYPGPYDLFLSHVGPSQRTMLIPGGALGPDVFATDPVPFYNKLISDPKVIAMIPFIWFNVGAYTGIHYDGRAPDYCRVGVAIKNGMKAKKGVVLLDPCSAFGGGATTQ